MKHILAYIERRGEQYFVKSPGSMIVGRGDDKVQAAKNYFNRVADFFDSGEEGFSGTVFDYERDKPQAIKYLQEGIGLERDSVIDGLVRVLLELHNGRNIVVGVEVYQITAEDLRDYREECQNMRGFMLDGEAHISQSNAREIFRLVETTKAEMEKPETATSA